MRRELHGRELHGRELHALGLSKHQGLSIRVPDSDYFVLWRKAMLDPSWPSDGGVDARG